MPRLASQLPYCWAWLILGLVHCGGARAVPTRFPNPTAHTRDWHLEFVWSGGLAGSAKTLELSSTGGMKVTDQKRRRQVATRLPDAEVAGIHALLADLSRLQPTGSPPACRDCFQYDLDVRLDGHRYSFRVNDLNLSQAGFSRLVNQLRELVERALAGDARPQAHGGPHAVALTSR